MYLRYYTRRMRKTLASEGIGSALSKTLGALTRHILGTTDTFDRRHRAETSRTVELPDLLISSPDRAFGNRYQATDPEWLVNGVVWIEGDLSRFTFVDLGCGKGRALLLAAELGFRRLVGVEFAADLIALARKNLGRGGIEARLLNISATEFEFPDEPLVVFMFNPFQAAVLRKVIAALCASLRAKPREVYLLYAYPEHAAVIDERAEFRQLHAAKGLRDVSVWKAR